MQPLLDRWHITPNELADRLGINAGQVEALLARPRRAPLVMLDGEDSTALREDARLAARQNAIEAFRNAAWGGTLGFYRPPGFALPSSSAELLSVLGGVASGDASNFPVDGIIFPKIEHPEEVELLFEVLSAFEHGAGLPDGRIGVGLLVESGWCAARLPEIVERAAGRLTSLIFGLADYSADLGLPGISIDHPLADWVRAEIVTWRVPPESRASMG